MEKVIKSTHKNYLKQFSATLIVFLMVILMSNLVIGMTFDNIKFFDKDVGDYGKVSIRDWFGILKLTDLELKTNTDTCGSSCSAEIEIIMYQDGILIDSIRFLEQQDNGGWLEKDIERYNFKIKTGTEQYSVDDFKETCENVISPEGFLVKECNKVKTGSHLETRDIWEDYNLGEEVESGNYYIKLSGNKGIKKNIDWQITSQGKLLDVWALWSSDFNEFLQLVFGFEKVITTNVGEERFGLHNATLEGGAVVNGTDCIVDNCIHIDGTDDFFSITDYAGISAMSNFTIMGWYKILNAPTLVNLFQKYTDPTTQAEFDFLIANTEVHSSFYDFLAGGENYIRNSNATSGLGSRLFNGSWHHFAVTYNGNQDTSGLRFYLNGVEQQNNGVDAGTFTGMEDGSANMVFGKGTFNGVGSPLYWKGMMDELMIFNASLNNETINDIMKANLDGSSFGNTGVLIATLDNPADNFVSPTNSIVFNCSGLVSEATIRNISLWDNRSGVWVLNETQDFTVGGGVKNNSVFDKNISDSTLDWTCRVFDSNHASAWATNRTLIVDAGEPRVNITFPTGIVNYGKQDFNISLNWTVFDTTLDSCWFTYNNSNTTVICLDLNTTVTLQKNQQNITIYANDTSNNVGSDFIEWDYLVFENFRTFNSTTIETAIESLILNVNVLTGFNIQQAQLIYNNTIFSDSNIIDLGGGNFSVSRSITIPQGNQGFSSHNNTWFYNITIANDIFGNTTFFETAFSEQKVNELSFGFCDQSGLDVAMLNFTMVNEITGIEINASKNATTFQATFLIGLDSDNLIKTIAINNISVNSSRYNFCTAEETNRFITDMQLFYTAQGFTEKSYFLNSATLTNATNEIDLFLIDDAIGIEFFIDVEQNLFPLTSATISISKFFVGEAVFKTVEIDTTDGDGKITAFLDLNKDYRFTITKNGELLAILEKRAICEAAPCTLSLSITDETPDVYSGYNEIFAGQVAYNLSFNSGTKVVTFEFVDLTGLATSFRMDITKGSTNGSGRLISTQRLFTSAGSMTFDASNESGDLTARVFITRSPDQLIDFITFVISEVTEVLGILGLFVAFLIIITIIFGFAFSPRAFIFAIPLGLTLVKLMGIISLSNGAIVVIYLLAIVAATFISR